jgi:hypothetical protein
VALIEPTNRDDRRVNHDPGQGMDDPDFLIFHENWGSREPVHTAPPVTVPGVLRTASPERMRPERYTNAGVHSFAVSEH